LGEAIGFAEENLMTVSAAASTPSPAVFSHGHGQSPAPVAASVSDDSSVRPAAAQGTGAKVDINA